ncbi:MAG TPA: putative peptidoglycan glycosyltransferase FtsW [Chlamydiales bacterium]|jgi:cell division protein FtsW|nr:putative peptidoglycan glycosyltransferase FtsW [Chlamydiales bacterium]
MKTQASIVLVFSALLLFSIGLLMVFNTSSAEILDRSLDANLYTALYKQLAYGCVGIVLGFIGYGIGYERLLRWSLPLLGVATVLLAALFVPGIAQTINGARRWLSIFGFSFQPSEAVKILIPAVFIQWFLKLGCIDFISFSKILGLIAIPAGLILMEPDNGTVAILISLMVVLFWLANIRWRYWAIPLLSLIAIGGAAAFKMPHVPDRIRIYLHPELDLRGKGHQPHQAKIAAGSGGLFGRGLGESLQKLNYLPEARSDYIAAIYAEEIGFLGMVLLIGLYAAFAYAGFSIAFKAREKGAFLLAAVLTFLIAIQAFLNLGIVSGLLPSKGMTLPFFSQGGSSLMVNVIIVFLLLDISRKSIVIVKKRRV